MIERIVASNLSRHFEQNDILYDLQHGFRERRSCETQLIQLVEELARNTSQGLQTDLILLDFSKAFDRVNHMKLLHKLHQHGARGNTLSWIKAFLTECSQSVVLEGESSSEIPVNSGVPRGSVLGPLLFYYILTTLLRTYTHRSDFLQMSTAIYITINNPSDSDTLQQDLDTLQTWERLWYMDFNPSKCQLLHISKSRHPAQHIYMLHGQALEAMNHAKYLGVDISRDLSWNTQINRISTTANRRLGFLKRNIKTINTAIRTAAYQTQVRPQIEYASTTWSPFTQTYINKIEMFQRRALRWVNSNYSTYTTVWLTP